MGALSISQTTGPCTSLHSECGAEAVSVNPTSMRRAKRSFIYNRHLSSVWVTSPSPKLGLGHFLGPYKLSEASSMSWNGTLWHSQGQLWARELGLFLNQVVRQKHCRHILESSLSRDAKKYKISCSPTTRNEGKDMKR